MVDVGETVLSALQKLENEEDRIQLVVNFARKQPGDPTDKKDMAAAKILGEMSINAEHLKQIYFLLGKNPDNLPKTRRPHKQIATEIFTVASSNRVDPKPCVWCRLDCVEPSAGGCHPDTRVHHFCVVMGTLQVRAHASKPDTHRRNQRPILIRARPLHSLWGRACARLVLGNRSKQAFRVARTPRTSSRYW